MNLQQVRINAWYGDQAVPLRFPSTWEVVTHRPRTPSPLRDDDLRQALRQPRGQPPIRVLARGRDRPVIVVDDCTRPTPADRVLPFLLEELNAARISTERTSIVVATGTHGPPTDSALRQKIGSVAAAHCQVHVHDDRRDLVRLGADSRGSPVLLNRHVAAADYVIGIGGVYPQNSTGFGGGAKLVLGVLGRRTIVHLHYGNSSENGSYNVDNDFRRELEEIADMARLETSVCLHVDGDREITKVTAGDHRAFYREAVAFARTAYRAQPPQDADVVVAAAYPMDLSLTFLRSKAITPLSRARPGASRILIAGCPEGVGRHGLYPFEDHTPAARLKHVYRHLLVHPGQVPRASVAKAAWLIRTTSSRFPVVSHRPGRQPQAGHSSGPPGAGPMPTWLYTPNAELSAWSGHSLRVTDSWQQVLQGIGIEQGGRPLQVALYPCSPLQVLDEHAPDPGVGF
jgi:nickel-dependent lactate racemase